jgi:regulatory protein
MQARLSLKGRALQLLALRDQSRVELRRKLCDHVARAAYESGDAEADRATQGAQVEAVLDWLEANRYLSAERFAESRVHARSPRYGNLRIKSELAQHGVALPAETARALADSELQRAAAVCARRFRAPPADAAQRAAQSRFLAARGFSSEVIHRLMRQLREVVREGATGGVDEGT